MLRQKVQQARRDETIPMDGHQSRYGVPAPSPLPRLASSQPPADPPSHACSAVLAAVWLKQIVVPALGAALCVVKALQPVGRTQRLFSFLGMGCTLADSYRALRLLHSFFSLSISFLRRFSSSLAATASTSAFVRPGHAKQLKQAPNMHFLAAPCFADYY
ncbi:MAG: hypothetical protein FRX49_06393 [Trebouxia sp. A1-2]|nr:MAG: hypothetical protein FRX49_06393 [Trebouxia sp. A1-2]